MVIDDLAAHRERWAKFAPAAVDRGLSAALGIPMHIDGTTVGALNVYHAAPRAWTDGVLGLPLQRVIHPRPHAPASRARGRASSVRGSRRKVSRRLRSGRWLLVVHRLKYEQLPAPPGAPLVGLALQPFGVRHAFVAAPLCAEDLYTVFPAIVHVVRLPSGVLPGRVSWLVRFRRYAEQLDTHHGISQVHSMRVHYATSEQFTSEFIDAIRTGASMDDPTAASRQRLADYLYEQARWRDLNAEEHPEDDRNRRSAEGLRSLASHVHNLDDDDDRLYVLAALDADHDEAFQPGAEAERLTRRFRFDLRNETPDAWFERFIDALSRDHGWHQP